jgi:DNA-binding transcriptional LysR family regulator
MRFKGLDLNLLVALDALLDEQSVSRAAERLHVSQPAMSAALTRMRTYFGDPILHLHGKRMVPTAHAVRIRPKLKALLRDVDGLISETSKFDPATSDRVFRICTSDFIMAVIIRPLVQELEQSAPGISLECTSPSDTILTLLNQGVLDVLITPEEHISPDHPSELFFEEKHVVAGWSRNPVIRDGRISAEDFFAAGHVVVELGQVRPSSFAELQMLKLGRPRHIDMRVSSFLVAPEMVVNTSRLTVMHERLARYFADRLDIAIAEPPFEIPVMREMLQYHQTRQNDPALRWLLGKLRDEAARVG